MEVIRMRGSEKQSSDGADENHRGSFNDIQEKLQAAAPEAVATLRANLSSASPATRIRAAVDILHLGAMSAEIRKIETRLSALERKKGIVSTAPGVYRSNSACPEQKAEEISEQINAREEVATMSLKPLEHRVRRLEEDTDGGHCDGCNQVGMWRILIRLDGTVTEPNGSYCIEPDWSTTDLACCPRCGDTNPKVSIEFARDSKMSKQFYEDHRTSIEFLRRANREAASKLTKG
jgi:hypothetical protein